MKEAELQIFIDSLRHYFATNIGGNLEIQPSYHTETTGTPASEYTGIIGVSGDKQGSIYLTATKEIRARVLQEAPSAMRRTFTLREFAALCDVTPVRFL